MTIIPKNIKKIVILLILGIIILPNLIVLINFGKETETGCCGPDCQCSIEINCKEMTISSNTYIFLPIPLVIIDIQELDEVGREYCHLNQIKTFIPTSIEYFTVRKFNLQKVPSTNYINIPLLI